MELSARNQLKGTVKQVKTDGVMAEVVIDLQGQEIVATITKASVDRLKLKKGDAALAIIKASEVIVAK
jgi:molybdopterin-binding protein